MIYKPGDLVWVKFPGQKEYPAEVITFSDLVDAGGCDEHGCRAYWLSGPFVAACATLLRPRRDDYQQREGKGNLKELDLKVGELFPVSAV